ncbi:MAG: undecaprenyl-diphosphatase UppP [Candidatus Paceibacterota bacterium]
MMEIVNSVILGIVQGATEFIPVSSSGHLILAREILGMNVAYSLAFDAVLQLATTLAVLVYFRKDIFGLVKNFFKFVARKNIEPKELILLKAVILGTIPAVVIGLFLEDSMDTLFRNSFLVAMSLIVGGLIMFFAERFSKRYAEKNVDLNVKRGIGVGFFQALALIPGFSRSGMTISGGLFLGLKREEATRFAFVLAFPVLLGAGLKKLLDLGSNGVLNSIGIELFAGSLASFFVGILAIHFLVTFLKKHTMNAFVVYRFVLAIAVLFFV